MEKIQPEILVGRVNARRVESVRLWSAVNVCVTVASGVFDVRSLRITGDVVQRPGKDVVRVVKNECCILVPSLKIFHHACKRGVVSLNLVQKGSV